MPEPRNGAGDPAPTRSAPTPHNGGCAVPLVIMVLTIIALLIGGRACTYVGHVTVAKETSQRGKEVLALLDSCGPVEPAEGRRHSSSPDPLYSGTNDDPGGYYTYYGKAQFAVETPDANGLAPEEAYQTLLTYLTDDGWNRIDSTYIDDPNHHAILRDGKWRINISWEEGNPATGGDPGRVWFELRSPRAGGFVLPGL